MDESHQVAGTLFKRLKKDEQQQMQMLEEEEAAVLTAEDRQAQLAQKQAMVLSAYEHTAPVDESPAAALGASSRAFSHQATFPICFVSFLCLSSPSQLSAQFKPCLALQDGHARTWTIRQG